MPEVIAPERRPLVEVGTTNKTRLADYERGDRPATRAAPAQVHPSNYRDGRLHRGSRRARNSPRWRSAHGLPLLDDLGSGTLVDLRRFGLPAEPTVQASVRAAATWSPSAATSCWAARRPA